MCTNNPSLLYDNTMTTWTYEAMEHAQLLDGRGPRSPHLTTRDVRFVWSVIDTDGKGRERPLDVERGRDLTRPFGGGPDRYQLKV